MVISILESHLRFNMEVNKLNAAYYSAFTPYEIDILLNLKNLPVIKLQSVDCNYIFSVEGKTAILYLYIDGIVKENNNSEELNMLGKFLAEFHNQC